jgi:hypothetical protein
MNTKVNFSFCSAFSALHFETCSLNAFFSDWEKKIGHRPGLFLKKNKLTVSNKTAQDKSFLGKNKLTVYNVHLLNGLE